MNVKTKFFLSAVTLAAITACLAAFADLSKAQEASDRLTIIALGDSLTAGYGLPPGEAFAEQLDRAVKARGHDVDIINAGVSGDTSTGGLARVDWSVPPEADAVIIELGANDALRGIDPTITRTALETLTKTLIERGQPVLIAGMMAPLNLGPEYGDMFNGIYSDIAERHDTLLYPFFLDGVATDPTLNQADGIHPTSEGVAIIVERIMPFVEDLIVQAKNVNKTN